MGAARPVGGNVGERVLFLLQVPVHRVAEDFVASARLGAGRPTPASVRVPRGSPAAPAAPPAEGGDVIGPASKPFILARRVSIGEILRDRLPPEHGNPTAVLNHYR